MFSYRKLAAFYPILHSWCLANASGQNIRPLGVEPCPIRGELKHILTTTFHTIPYHYDDRNW